jgi:hypothetical protein
MPPAEMSRLDAIRKAFDGSRGYLSDSDVNLVVALVCVLVGALILFIAARILWKSAWVRENPYLLFWELCWAHRLSISDSVLLLRAAKRLRMANPSFVFLEPDAFARPVHGFSESEESRFEGLYHRLF